MNQSETKPILYEIECPLCNGVFTMRFDPKVALTEHQIKSSKQVKQTRPCPLCKQEITYELPAMLVPKQPVERYIRGE